MLPPFIIEQIRKREKQERVHYEQPQLELPVQPHTPRRPEIPKDDVERGVVILDL
jgi:hypothetical protein